MNYFGAEVRNDFFEMPHGAIDIEGIRVICGRGLSFIRHCLSCQNIPGFCFMLPSNQGFYIFANQGIIARLRRRHLNVGNYIPLTTIQNDHFDSRFVLGYRHRNSFLASIELQRR